MRRIRSFNPEKPLEVKEDPFAYDSDGISRSPSPPRVHSTAKAVTASPAPQALVVSGTEERTGGGRGLFARRHNRSPTMQQQQQQQQQQQLPIPAGLSPPESGRRGSSLPASQRRGSNTNQQQQQQQQEQQEKQQQEQQEQQEQELDAPSRGGVLGGLPPAPSGNGVAPNAGKACPLPPLDGAGATSGGSSAGPGGRLTRNSRSSSGLSQSFSSNSSRSPANGRGGGGGGRISGSSPGDAFTRANSFEFAGTQSSQHQQQQQHPHPQPRRRGLFRRRRSDQTGEGEAKEIQRRSMTTDDINYPRAQPMHRLRSAEASNGPLSEDPDFQPPIPLERACVSAAFSDDGEGGEYDGEGGLGGGGGRTGVRYGDFIRFWAYSSYEHDGGYIGYMRRVSRRRHAVGKGELFVIPPVPPAHRRTFHEVCFKVVDPQAEKEDGDLLHFGHEFSMVDDRGMVWNNKDGHLHGRLGPALFGNGGHMLMTLLKNEGGTGAGTSSGVWSAPNSPPPGAAHGGFNGAVGPPIMYGDNCILVAKKVRPNRKGVVRAPVTQYRRRGQQLVGGFLRSDGKGRPISFTIHHAPPKISTVSVFAQGPDGSIVDTHTHYRVPWLQELEFDMPPETAATPTVGGGIGILNDALDFSNRKLSLAGGGAVSAVSNAGGCANSNGQQQQPPQTASGFMANLSGHGSISGGDAGMEDEDDMNTEESKETPVIRVALSNGGEAVLRRTELLQCKDRALWLDVSDTELPFSLLVKCRSLRGSDKDVKGGEGMWSKYAATSALAFLFCCAVQMTKLLPLGSGLGSLVWEMVIHSLLLVVALVYCRAVFQPEVIGGAAPFRDRYAVKLIRLEQGFAAAQKAYVEEPAEDIPPLPGTFLIAEDGDEGKAIQRWRDTLQWRAEVRADEVLQKPHPLFDVIKMHYPTAFFGRDRGGAVIYYEQLGKIDIESLRKLEVSEDQLVHHYMYQMEYLWRVINPRDEDRTCSVMDMKGVALTSISADVKAFIIRAVTMMSTHYPARSECIYIINVPRWFNIVFALVKPLLNETQRAKIRVCVEGKVKKELMQRIDEAQLPREYGGGEEGGAGSSKALLDSPWELDMRAHVLKVLADNGETMVPVPEG